MNSIAQNFSTTQAASKVELAVRVLQVSSSTALQFLNDSLVIDATNISSIASPNAGVTFADDGTTFTGSGYMHVSGETAFSYAVTPVEDGQYYTYFRIRPRSSEIDFDVLVDGVKAGAGSNTISNFSYSDTWIWIQVNIVFIDVQQHTFTISPTVGLFDVDKIAFNKTHGAFPFGDGPNYSSPTYSTAHVRIFSDSSGLPGSPISYDAKTSLDSIFENGTVAFACQSNAGANWCVLSSSGSSSSRALVWDVAPSDSLPSAVSTNGGAWITDDTTSLGLNVYSEQASISGGVMITPDATSVTDVVDDFTTTTNPRFCNTDIIVDDVNDVILDTSDKLISIVVDQSGSNTWNDSENLRIDITNEIVETIDQRYPGNVRYNLFSAGASKSFSIFAALPSQITSNNISDIVKTLLANDPSNFVGFRLIRKEGEYSQSPMDGEIVTDGYALAGLDVGLTEYTEYFYTLFTYDKYNRYSEGIQIAVTARDRILPRGIPSFTGQVYTASGAIIAPNTVAIWQTDEGSGDYIYDYSLSELDLQLTKVRWLDAQDSPIGQFGIRLNGETSTAVSSPTTIMSFGPNSSFTIALTVYPLDITTDNALVVKATDTQFCWGVEIAPGGKLRIRMGTFIATSTLSVAENVWTGIGFSYDAINKTALFVAGNQSETVAFSPTSNPQIKAPMNVGFDPSDTFTDAFFGKLTHISIYDTVGNAGVVQSAINPGTPDDGSLTDNGDRVVALTWDIPDDFDFVGGNTRLLVNKVGPPQHENDGTILDERPAEFGTVVFNASAEYDTGHTYYFRLFSQNTYGNWCDVDDSTVVAINIPSVARFDDEGNPIGPGFGSTPTPEVTLCRPGNAKVWIKWDVQSDPDTHRIVIYYGGDTGGCPFYDAKTQTISGTIIYDEPVEYATDFVARNLPNYDNACFAVVTLDKYERFSQLATASAMPLPQLDDSGIPLLEGLNVTYHITDYDQIEIRWDSPVTFTSSVSGYFDEIVYVYGAICDLYGNPLSIDYPDNFNITSTITNTVQSQIEDVFNLGIGGDISQIPQATFAFDGGLLVGRVQLINSPTLSTIETLSIGVSAVYNYSSTFTYSFPTLVVTFNNPISLQLLNRDSSYLSLLNVFGTICGIPQESGPPPDPLPPGDSRVECNGCYVRRQLPLALRAVYTYKGQPIYSPTLDAIVCNDTTLDGVNVNVCSVSPNISQPSTTVLFTSSSLSSSTMSQPILDNSGNPTSFTQLVSFTDFYVRPPYLPQTAIVYFLVQNNGYSVVKKINLFFPTILNIDLTVSSPKNDGIDVREQFAFVSIIDPDYPNDVTKITAVPDYTVVQWVLTGASTVPFYSTDNVPLYNGIYSYTRSGTARKVFFGPAAPSISGSWTITVHTTYEGLIV
jgi:hypothetical protein